MIKSIKLKNLLSFGDPGLDLELRPLNVLIGPNGSGKSNLIDAISLLQAAPRDIAEPIRTGGGGREWVHKSSERPPRSLVSAVVNTRSRLMRADVPIKHEVSLLGGGAGVLRSESIFRYRDGGWHAAFTNDLGAVTISPVHGTAQELEDDPRFDDDSSALSQLRGSNVLEISRLAREYENIRIYRDWRFGRTSVQRLPQRADEKNGFLAEDASNLGLVLNRFRSDSRVKKKVLEELRKLMDGVTDFDVLVQGGTVQLFLEEYGRTIPAVRLSDGTLRYLALLAILCDPRPPTLICLEEPELGLHPDLLPHVAKLMVEASERCQVIATTHSDVIVDALTEHAGGVVVCDRGEAGSTMRRLDPEQLKPWLENYRLGQLWSKGELGGNRW